MLSLHYSQKLLNLSGILIKDIFHEGNTTTFYIELPRKPHQCPCCHHTTSKVHDYRNQAVKWQQGILNTFRTPYTNGYTEGINNKIKVLKTVLSLSNQYTWDTPTIDKEPQKIRLYLFNRYNLIFTLFRE